MRSVQDVVCQKLFETIEFDDADLCNICKQFDFKVNEVDWKDRKLTLDKIIEENRGKFEYDCIIPFSGKDSTFTLYYLIKEYSLKPLVVQFNHGFMRPNLLKIMSEHLSLWELMFCLSLLIGR